MDRATKAKKKQLVISALTEQRERIADALGIEVTNAPSVRTADRELREIVTLENLSTFLGAVEDAVTAKSGRSRTTNKQIDSEGETE